MNTGKWLGILALILGTPLTPLLSAPAHACIYHAMLGLPEPIGFWPSQIPAAPTADGAAAQLKAQDAMEDAAVSQATGGSQAAAASSAGTLQWTGQFSAQSSQNISDPAVTSWLRNTTGATGTSVNAAVNSVVSKVQANVQTVAYNNTHVYVKATGIPSYSLGQSATSAYGADPAIPTNVNVTYDIPRTPTPNAGTKTSTGLGAIGLAVNGAAIYNPWDGMTYQNDGVWQQNANAFESSTFDAGPGHPAPLQGQTVTTSSGTAPAGVYHYHQSPTSLISQIDPGNSGQHASPVLGYAADGYPIFGPYGYVVDSQGQIVYDSNGQPKVQLMTSSYQLRTITSRTTLPNGSTASAVGPAVSAQFPLGDYLQDFLYTAGSGTLDQYNGRFAVAPGYPNGTYGYYVTSTYPYIIGPQYYGTVQTDDLPNGVVVVPGDVTIYDGTPEPSSAGLLALLGAGGLLGRRRRAVAGEQRREER